MELEVVVEEGERRRRFVGLRVCQGPGMMRLLLTRPYDAAGRIVDIPVDEAKEVRQVQSGPLSEPVEHIRSLDPPA